MKPHLITTATDEGKKLLARRARTVKNVFTTDVILDVQNMKRIAQQWEADTGRQCDGLAATQIGSRNRIVILRNRDGIIPPKNVFTCHTCHNTFLNETGYCPVCSTESYRFMLNPEWVEYEKTARFNNMWRVLINPYVLKREGSYESHEGCLSVPGVEGKVTRSRTVIFRYRTEKNTKSPLLVATTSFHDDGRVKNSSAAAIEHELDHLNGKTLLDTASEVLLSTARLVI